MTLRCTVILGVLALLTSLPAKGIGQVLPSAASGPQSGAIGEDVISAELDDAMALARGTNGTGMIPVYLVMRDHLDASLLTKETRGMTRSVRRAKIMERLKQHATESQSTVLDVLSEAAANGLAGAPQILWMGNALIVSAKPEIIETLAEMPSVMSIRLDRTPDPGEIEDGMLCQQLPLAGPLPPSTSSDVHSGVAPYPFSDDFESGTLMPWWKVETTGKGYAEVSTANGPLGTSHLLMASSVDGVDSTASVTVTLDLRGKSGVGLRFQFKSFYDEPDELDGVFVSNGGSHYYLALALQNADAEYSQKTLDLDKVANDLGIEYSDNVHIRFQWHDNFNIPTDGFAFDNIIIGPHADDVSPPPEPNLVALQAPELWALGFRGEGVLIGTIDSGVLISHPDLKKRIWNNPGEIEGNGIDDDRNGLVDDIHGWDFMSGTNDVTSFDPHGTNTAGIAVGDGSGGKATGMAPGATLLVCEVLSQTDYWLAQQYCLQEGVDVITSSVSYKWPSQDYHMFRELAEVELAAGIVHANSIGNAGQQATLFPIPFNISAPGNCPAPFTGSKNAAGGHTSIMACGGIELPTDSSYEFTSLGPAAWEDMNIYDSNYPFVQNVSFWDYPYGGFMGGLKGLIKPDVVAYASNITTTNYFTQYIDNFEGTSAATPHVAGALALLREVQPYAEVRHLAEALQLSASDLGVPGRDNVFGAGKVRVLDAARRLRLLVSAEDQSPAIGGDLVLNIYGGPSSVVFGWFAGEIVDGPGPFNLLKPLFPLGIVPLDQTGVSHIAYLIPSDPMLIGATIWIQFASKKWDPAWGPQALISVPESVTIDP